MDRSNMPTTPVRFGQAKTTVDTSRYIEAVGAEPGNVYGCWTYRSEGGQEVTFIGFYGTGFASGLHPGSWTLIPRR
ncbi:hypothetical protein ACQSSU_20370 [Micromonospora echinospora]